VKENRQDQGNCLRNRQDQCGDSRCCYSVPPLFSMHGDFTSFLHRLKGSRSCGYPSLLILPLLGNARWRLRVVEHEVDKRKLDADEVIEALLLDGLESGDSVEVTPGFWEDFELRRERRRTERDPATE
jgi:hypothetical protein